MINFDEVDVVDEVDRADMLRLPRRIYFRRDLFNSFDDTEFFIRFRLTKATILMVLRQIEQQLEYTEDKNNSISPINQLLLTLRVYSTGSHLLSVGDLIGADKSTVSRVVAKVTRALASLLRQYIYMPRNNIEKNSVQNKFYEAASFPRVLGAIDGSHVKILSPGGADAEIYRNRKGYFSINIQAVSDGNFLFRDLVARWPGSAHDATVFNASRIKHRFEQGEFGEGILLGDSGYMSKNYLLTPLLNPTTEPERKYNSAHIRTRVKVENIFGIWKRRFPIMAYGCRLKLNTTLQLIIATAVLHNIARVQGEPEPPLPDDVMHHELQQLIENGNIPNVVNHQDQREDFRRNLINNYFTRL